MFKIVFTDLDGTLLDHHSYDYRPAVPALNRLKEENIPLIMVSSKTRIEMEKLREELNNDAPFIVENGGALFIPKSSLLIAPSDAEDWGDYRVIILGKKNSVIKPLFRRLADAVPARALSDMSIDEIVERTGLTADQARGAGNREFGEAFVTEEKNVDEDCLAAAVASLGLRLTRGGRFYHLLGENDKGLAVRMLIEMYARHHPDLITAGCGDAPNDEPMLKAVNRAYLIARPDGSHHRINVPHLIRIHKPGPDGFHDAIFNFLEC